MTRHPSSGRSPFRDRDDAGGQVASALERYADRSDVLVLGLPRGGVVVAARVAERLRAALDVVVARKLRTPGHAELAMGALAVWGERVAVIHNERIVEAGHIAAGDVQAEQEQQLNAARERAHDWSPEPPELADRIVIVVDDGLATGATMRASLDVLRSAGAGRLVVGLPVAPATEIADLRARADDVVCVQVPERFGSVGAHYVDFGEVADADVRGELDRARGTYR